MYFVSKVLIIFLQELHLRLCSVVPFPVEVRWQTSWISPHGNKPGPCGNIYSFSPRFLPRSNPSEIPSPCPGIRPTTPDSWNFSSSVAGLQQVGRRDTSARRRNRRLRRLALVSRLPTCCGGYVAWRSCLASPPAAGLRLTRTNSTSQESWVEYRGRVKGFTGIGPRVICRNIALQVAKYIPESPAEVMSCSIAAQSPSWRSLVALAAAVVLMGLATYGFGILAIAGVLLPY
uniref:Uncharacterized protein n=1 Tax=Zea mays TaxID=4577 RepID=A0A804QQY8_MAIZE